MERYETVKPLGKGDSSLVQRKEDHELFVCKKITYSSIDDANKGLQGVSIKTINNEIEIYVIINFINLRPSH